MIAPAGVRSDIHFYETSNRRLNIRADYAAAQFCMNITASLGNQIILGNGYAQDFDHASQTNPTFYVHSVIAPNTDNTQWISMTHDQTDGVIDVGKGDIKFNSSIVSTATANSSYFTSTGLTSSCSVYISGGATSGDAQHLFRLGTTLKYQVGYDADPEGYRIYSHITTSNALFIASATNHVTFGGQATFSNSVDSGAVADQVSIGGYEIGAGNRVLAISQETVVAAEVDETKFSHKLQVRINGATYFLMLCDT